MADPQKFRFSIDRGGTFTDIHAELPGGETTTLKLLSEDPQNYSDAPREGIRRVLAQATGRAYPQEGFSAASIEWVRMGTTVATNALLERQGEPLVLVTTRGFGDALRIGYQNRPRIFDLRIDLPSQLYRRVIEVDERVVLERADTPAVYSGARAALKRHSVPSGDVFRILQPLDEAKAERALREAHNDGLRAVAIVLMHAYAFAEHEKRLGELAASVGFTQISLSHQVHPALKLVARGDTTCVDAYLTPHIRRYLQSFRAGFSDQLRDTRVLFMQSHGGLIDASEFLGSRAILSGPAGGVVGYARSTESEDAQGRRRPIIGFDMGGTSTDVSRYGGEFSLTHETELGGVRIQAPQLDIQTVAAGGGSRLFYRNGLFQVGPQSAGAHPGPVCYRKGGPVALTDANLVLGRIPPQHFPHIFGPDEDQPLDREGARHALEALAEQINADRRQGGMPDYPLETVALGFVRAANETMARPIREISVARGHDLRRHVLACFGGAGGQHACAIARSLGIETLFIHRHGGILSAYGMAMADLVREYQLPAAGQPLSPQAIVELKRQLGELAEQGKQSLIAEGLPAAQIRATHYLNLRFEGTITSMMIPAPTDDDYEKAFRQQHLREYGFDDPQSQVLVDDLRVRLVGEAEHHAMSPIAAAATPQPPRIEDVPCYFEQGWCETPVYAWDALRAGHTIEGPALILQDGGTILVEPRALARVTARGHLRIELLPAPNESSARNVYESDANGSADGVTRESRSNGQGPSVSGTSNEAVNGLLSKAGSDTHSRARDGVRSDNRTSRDMAEDAARDTIRLGIFNNLFMSIAEQCGRTLQRTSVSTNIKERLDFSCALFDAKGGLVANAPHIPVHLGAMSDAVKAQLALRDGDLRPGDALVGNNPNHGGSHLPDVTVITPVFRGAQLLFFVANRGHHAEIGGLSPGSMPPFSKQLSEEGVCISSFKLVEDGVLQEAKLRALLTEGAMPSRRPEDNLHDLKSQLAANQKGVELLQEMVASYGLEVVQAYMGYIQDNAEEAVRRLVAQCAAQHGFDPQQGGVLKAIDYLDDGSPIAVQITLDCRRRSFHFDFSGSGPLLWGNLNTPQAVVKSVIVYVLRTLIDEELPLNGGFLKAVSWNIPHPSLLSPTSEAAVVGGNVETSSRITDVLLRAFGAVAAAQGTMNNLTFGNESFGYYETIGGGTGAGNGWHGKAGLHAHMSNARITDPEVLERRYPIWLRRFSIRPQSGGEGRWHGGEGVLRELEFLRPMNAAIISERRVYPPYGLDGGQPGALGRNTWLRRQPDGDYIPIALGGKNEVQVQPGDRIRIETPGGGGFGA